MPTFKPTEQDVANGWVDGATRRPDGTWRKPVRVKEGWVGDLDKTRYESRGAKAAAGMKCAVASIPGAAAGAGAPPASTKTKAQIKNEKRKAKKAAGEGDDDDEDGAGDGSSAVPSADAQANEMVQKMASASLEPTAAAPAVAEDPAKKLKNLKKKLKQIDQLVESGAALSEDQQAKVSRRAELVAEIEALE